MAAGSWTAGRMLAPKLHLVLDADECPGQDSSSSGEWNGALLVGLDGGKQLG